MPLQAQNSAITLMDVQPQINSTQTLLSSKTGNPLSTPEAMKQNSQNPTLHIYQAIENDEKAEVKTAEGL